MFRLWEKNLKKQASARYCHFAMRQQTPAHIDFQRFGRHLL